MLKTVPDLKETSEPTGELKQSRLVLGTASFGMKYGATNTVGEVRLDEIREILQICREANLRELDTAQAYGSAEEKLGAIGVGDFAITTKIHLGMEENAESLRGKLALSLTKLRVKKIENLLLHNEERLDLNDADKVAFSLHALVKEGLVDNVGVSSYEPANALVQCQKYGFQITQVPGNALDNRLFEDGLIDRFLKKNIQVQVRSAFLQGILLRNPPSESGVPPTAIDQAVKFRNRCLERGWHPLQGALQHILQASKHVKVVLGVTGSGEFRQILDNLQSVPSVFQFDSPVWNPAFDPRKWKK